MIVTAKKLVAAIAPRRLFRNSAQNLAGLGFRGRLLRPAQDGGLSDFISENLQLMRIQAGATSCFPLAREK